MPLELKLSDKDWPLVSSFDFSECNTEMLNKTVDNNYILPPPLSLSSPSSKRKEKEIFYQWHKGSLRGFSIFRKSTILNPGRMFTMKWI